MGTRHKRVGDWFLTYSFDSTGKKELLGATNPEENIYVSDGDNSGRQDPLKSLYDSKKLPELDSSHTENVERRNVTTGGLGTLEYNIREEAAQDNNSQLSADRDRPVTDGGQVSMDHFTGKRSCEELLSERN